MVRAELIYVQWVIGLKRTASFGNNECVISRSHSAHAPPTSSPSSHHYIMDIGHILTKTLQQYVSHGELRGGTKLEKRIHFFASDTYVDLSLGIFLNSCTLIIYMILKVRSFSMHRVEEGERASFAHLELQRAYFSRYFQVLARFGKLAQKIDPELVCG